MMKDLLFLRQQQVLEENMSNLTSASGDASASSDLYFAPPHPDPDHPPPPKKKRNLPGNPDPDAEVIALSPRTLLATNRFLCEICNKGFQRDQNLQLHRRGHNLPWKLNTRTNKEVMRKKVYVCPEPNCVHHDPSRALGDLTGIKKHFCRKHGEKKWKCEKCSKKYAVQSDWKAHSKICGSREYRCDCGTLFSRRDSFITHRAFCDALAEENSRANPLFSGSSSTQFNNLQLFPSLKEEPQINNSFNLLPPWLGPPPQVLDHHQIQSSSPPSIFLDQDQNHQLPNPNPNLSGPTLPPSQPHMSITALLQKAAEMGATMSTYQHGHVTAESGASSSSFVSRDPGSNSLLQAMVKSLSNGTFAIDDSFGSKKLDGAKSGNGNDCGNGGEALTRDFLGIRGFSHSDILHMTGFSNCMNTEQQHNQLSQEPWQGN